MTKKKTVHAKQGAAESAAEEKSGPTAAEQPAAAETQQDPLAELQSQLQSREEELQQTHDRLLRLSAEFENFKKRQARETADFRKYANQSLLKELLPVVDNLELALKATDGQTDIDRRLIEGLEMTHRELLKVLERFHVVPIEAVGQPFNPELHEAVMREPTEEHPENTVISEFQKGYKIHDRLLRPAMVVVAAPKSGAGGEGASGEGND